jgi:type IV secretion system protein VirB6
MLSVIIYFVNLLVLCTVGAALLIYMSPIFVPMALFAPTKSYFDGWLKLLISFALQPMVVASYMALMLTIFDNAMFGDCSFINQNLTFNVGTASTPITKEIPYFMLCDPWSTTCEYGTNEDLTKCTQTIGYQMNPMQSGSSLTETFTALFFNLTILNPSVVGNMLSSLITLCLFAFLFYKFAEVLSQFTAELTGGINVGAIAGNPMALVDKAAALVKAYVKAKMGDKKGAAEELKKATGSGAEGKTRSGGGSGATASIVPKEGGGDSSGASMVIKPSSIPGK